jgi:glycerol uptake facilitator-like aquaporin
LSLTGAAIDQIFGTALLIILVLAVTDKKNVEMPHGTSAIVIALTILAIGVSFAHNCGYAINPTRDLGPRLFTFVAGWGSQVFSSGRYFFWVRQINKSHGTAFWFGHRLLLFRCSNYFNFLFSRFLLCVPCWEPLLAAFCTCFSFQITFK